MKLISNTKLYNKLELHYIVHKNQKTKFDKYKQLCKLLMSFKIL